MAAGEKGHEGSTVTQGSQARSTRMEPLDGGVLLPSGEHTAVFHPCSIKERRWAKTAGGRLGKSFSDGGDSQLSWLHWTLLFPEPVGGLPFAGRVGEGDPKLQNLSALNRTQLGASGHPRPATLGQVLLQEWVPCAGAGVCTEPSSPAPQAPRLWSREGAAGRQPGPQQEALSELPRSR